MKTAIEWLMDKLPKSIETQFSKQIEQAKEMEKNYKLKATRVEVIQHSEPYNGRAYTNYNAKDVEIMLQDEGRTLKIFLK